MCILKTKNKWELDVDYIQCIVIIQVVYKLYSNNSKGLWVYRIKKNWEKLSIEVGIMIGNFHIQIGYYSQLGRRRK